MHSVNSPGAGNEHGLCVAIKAYKPQLLRDVRGERNYGIATDCDALKHLLFVPPLQMPRAEQRSKR